MMKCPVCRADNTDTPNCRRCKADLSLLWTIAAQHKRALQSARQAAQQGDWQTMQQSADTATQLVQDDDNPKITALAALLRRDFAKALAVYSRVKNET